MPSSSRLSQVVARNFFALGAGESVARIVAFLATLVIARTLGAASYGVVGFAAAIMLYLARLADGGIEQGLGVRELAAASEADRPDLIATLVTARFLLSLGCGGALIIGAQLFAPEPEASVLTVMAIVLILQGASAKWVHLGLESARIVAGARTIGEIVMLGGVLLLVRGPGDVAAVPIAQVLGDSVLILILGYALLRAGRRIDLRMVRSVLAPLVPRATPLMLSALLGLVIFNSDLLFLRLYHNSTLVGYYAAAYGLISFFINMGGAYQQSLLPTLTRASSDEPARRELFGTATAQVIALTLPATIGVSLYASTIITTAFGAEFAPAGPALAWLSYSVLFLLNRSVPHVALLAVGREHLILRINIAATILNLGLNVFLIPEHGIIGAAASTVATEVLRWALAWLFSTRQGFSFSVLKRGWSAVIATGVMAIVVIFALPDNLWAGAPVGAATYFAVLTLLGGVTWSSGRPRLTV